MKKTILQILICFSLLICIPHLCRSADRDEEKAAETVFKLFYSANVLGELEACG
ncbi:MAG: hypothetical protein HKP41_02435 [Desulfobacterales bacterium]|nr:hypothetical protein [Desulfobacterales bacterium]